MLNLTNMQFLSTIFAAPTDPFGQVEPPPGLTNRFGLDPGGGFGALLQLVFNVLIVAGGIWALFNFLLAGYAFLAAGDNPKGVQDAWAKIYQTIIGLVFLVGSFLLAAVIGLLVFGEAGALLNPTIPTP